MKFIKNMLKLIIFLIVLSTLLSYCIGMNPFKKSGYANCIMAPTASAFTGDRLKHYGEVQRRILKTEECKALDTEIDQADGTNNGRVRWAECYVGPDCEEAGLL